MAAPPSAAASPLRSAVAWAPLERGLVRATGPAAVRFIDGFTTAAVGGLAPGTGAEGFFTDARGWVLALATILRADDEVLLVVEAGLAAGLRDHLEHYHIREPLELTDASPTTTTLLVAGPDAEAWLRDRAADPPPTAPLGHAATRLLGEPVRLVRLVDQGANGWLVQVAAVLADPLTRALTATGLPRAAADDVEAARIEARYPAAADVPPRTLPQELDRDRQAICFTKGCYLGQETVARIDALGHVNRRLVLLAIDSVEPPPPGTPVLAAGEPVGTVTSSCLSSALGAAAALALIHVRALAGGPLEVGGRPARRVPAPPGGKA